MVRAAVIVGVMNAKQRKGGRPLQRGDEPKEAVTFRIPASLLAALDKLAEQSRRPRSWEIEIAIEDRLKAAGLWPPKPAK